MLTYTTTGVFNFAHGASGMLAAFAYWQVGMPRQHRLSVAAQAFKAQAMAAADAEPVSVLAPVENFTAPKRAARALATIN